MKTSQFVALIGSQVSQNIESFAEIHLEAAERYNLKPFFKRSVKFGGIDGIIFEFFKDANNDVVYSVELCEACFFFKLDIVDTRTINVVQVGYHECYGKKNPTISLCEFADHDFGSWHIGFSAFDALLDAVEFESRATGRTDTYQALKDFYKNGEVSELDENFSRYFKRNLTVVGETNNAIQLTNERDGAIFATINI